jgi:hypothetical protein
VNQLVANWLGGQVGRKRTKDLMFAQGGILMLKSLEPIGPIKVGLCCLEREGVATASKLETKEKMDMASVGEQMIGSESLGGADTMSSL